MGKDACPNSKLTVRWGCLVIILFLVGYFLIPIIILQFCIILHIIPKKYREREEVSGITESTDSDSLFQYHDVSLWGFFYEMAEKETRFTQIVFSLWRMYTSYWVVNTKCRSLNIQEVTSLWHWFKKKNQLCKKEGLIFLSINLLKKGILKQLKCKDIVLKIKTDKYCICLHQLVC